MQDSLPNGYQRIRLLGQGASARVWLANGPDGPVAVKMATSPGGLAREIEALGMVSHPNLVQLHAADPDGNWLVVEHAAHGRADTWGRGQPMSVIVELAAQVASALGYLHARGIIHGDLKPSNVLVAADGSARLVDLGNATGSALPPGQRGGTLGFIAPELLTGGAAGPEADLYGLGVLLYLLLTRQPPFRNADPAALGYLPLTTLPEPPSSLKPRIPRDLDDLVLGLLARRPGSRPAPAERVAELLRASLLSSPRPPVVGMTREREVLRRQVVELLDGKPSTVVLHGNVGSGRRTLIRECVRAAKREGVRVVAGGSDRRQLLTELSDGRPTIVALDGNAPGVEALVSRIVSDRPLALTLVRADRPMMRIARLGGIHLCPCSLGVEDVARVLEGLELDRRRAEEYHRRSRGMPGSLIGLVTGVPVDAGGLQPLEGKVVTLLSGGPQTVDSMAQRIGISEHRLLDLVEPMIDRGLVTASTDGAWLMQPEADGN